jgi:RNA polymerase sigma-70 factor (ECF subfamily)
VRNIDIIYNIGINIPILQKISTKPVKIFAFASVTLLTTGGKRHVIFGKHRIGLANPGREVSPMTLSTDDNQTHDNICAEDVWPDDQENCSCNPAPDLFEEIRPFIPNVRRYLARRVPVVDIDDVLQDIFLRLCRRTEGTSVTHPRSYLFQVANAAVVDRHRRETSRCAAGHCELSDTYHPLDELSPLRILLSREDMHATEAALGALPERTREIIIAMRLEGLSLKSLAERYNISTSAIEKHVTRGMKALIRQRTNMDKAWPALAPNPVSLDCYI